MKNLFQVKTKYIYKYFYSACHLTRLLFYGMKTSPIKNFQFIRKFPWEVLNHKRNGDKKDSISRTKVRKKQVIVRLYGARIQLNIIVASGSETCQRFMPGVAGGRGPLRRYLTLAVRNGGGFSLRWILIYMHGVFTPAREPSCEVSPQEPRVKTPTIKTSCSERFTSSATYSNYQEICFSYSWNFNVSKVLCRLPSFLLAVRSGIIMSR